MSDDLLDEKPKVSAKQKKTLMLIIALVVVCVFFYIMFQATGQGGPKQAIKEEPIKFGENNLADDQYERFSQLFESQQETIVTLQNELNSFKKLAEQQDSEQDGALNELTKLMERDLERNTVKTNEPPPLSNDPSAAASNSPRYPEPPSYQPLNAPAPPQQVMIAEPTQIGGVGFLEFSPVGKKKAVNTTEEYYLPPSFFSAKLLTGIDAPTSQEGAEEPKQIMFMVDAPAQLPNYIKEDLSGCFVLGNANGDLGTERIEVIVVNMSCLSVDGTAVIDQPVLGFVNDLDGKRDMAGNVVSKEGSKLAWLFAASIVGGLGTESSIAGVDNNVTALGAVNSFDPSKALQRSLGAGVKDGADEYKSIILDYIRQSAPTIEVGPLKDVTVVIQEGVWLKIKSRQKQQGPQL